MTMASNVCKLTAIRGDRDVWLNIIRVTATELKDPVVLIAHALLPIIQLNSMNYKDKHPISYNN